MLDTSDPVVGNDRRGYVETDHVVTSSNASARSKPQAYRDEAPDL